MMVPELVRKSSNILVRTKFLKVVCSFCSNSSNENDSKYPKSKYKIFQDEDSQIILDVNEEKMHFKRTLEKPSFQPEENQPVEYRRGVTGVFDIEDLVDALRKDNAQDIFVVQVPKELNYVDYLVVATGRSHRHLLGLAAYIRSLFKKMKHDSDITPAIEGESGTEWIAMDLGNIALHIMSEPARVRYDLESLWSIGSQYDTQSNQEEDSILKLIKKHSLLLDDIHPLRG